MKADAFERASHARSTWHAYIWWTLTGLLGGFGIASILTIGAPLLGVAAVAALVGTLRPSLRGAPVASCGFGVAVPILWIAWLNRGGPGTVCHTSATEASCTDEWSPWPFVVVAVALVVATAIAVTFLARAERAHRPG